MISPYDLGTFQLIETSRKISIDELVSKAKKQLKQKLLEVQIKALGISIELTTSKTRFNGERLWFTCPFCNKRVGTLYQHPTQSKVGCRSCLNLKYRKQRFKGMIESTV